MLIGVQGSNAFNNYTVFMRAMGVALSDVQDSDKEITVYSFGPAKVNSFVAEFCNLSERGMKARGKKLRFFKVPFAWGEDHASSFNYFAYLSTPQEPTMSRLTHIMEDAGVETGVFQY